VRAFPESVTPPTSAFDVPNEQHEAQHNIEVLSTTKKQMDMSQGGAGVPEDPRHRDSGTGLWWERFTTLAVGKRGPRFVAWAFDPEPGPDIYDTVRRNLGRRRKFDGFSQQRPDPVTIEFENARGGEIKLGELPKVGGRGSRFTQKTLLVAGSAVLGPRTLSAVLLGFDHSSLEPRTAVVLHGAQWDESGRLEGGMTLVAMAPS
jgi:hypothetical protein